jgi:hypothetical protein
MNNMKHHMSLHIEGKEDDALTEEPESPPRFSDFLLRLGLANNNMKAEPGEEASHMQRLFRPVTF